jgi:hypothetical protein
LGFTWCTDTGYANYQFWDGANGPIVLNHLNPCGFVSAMNGFDSVTHKKTVKFKVTSTIGCTTWDSVCFKQVTALTANLGKDTTYCRGAGARYRLQVGDSIYSIRWRKLGSSTVLGYGHFYDVDSSGTYHVEITDPSGSCTARDTVKITIKERPTIAMRPYPISTTCKGRGLVLLDTAATPSGGVWSGNGVVHIGSHYYFNPDSASCGNHGITYTYTDSAGCTDVANGYVYKHCGDSMYPIARAYCTTDPMVALNGSPPFGTFSGTGVVQVGAQWFFNPEEANPTRGDYEDFIISFHYSDSGNCSGTDTFKVRVYKYDTNAVSQMPFMSDLFSLNCGNLDKHQPCLSQGYQVWTDSTLTIYQDKQDRKYLWSDSSTHASMTVYKKGTYWVQVSNGEGCYYTKTFTIDFDPCECCITDSNSLGFMRYYSHQDTSVMLFPTSVLQDPNDSGYVVLATAEHQDNLSSATSTYQIALVKHNKFGEVVWDRVISADSNLIARDILLLDDTGYVILASTNKFTMIFITDFSGTILKKNSYKYTFGHTIEKDYDALGDFSGYVMSSMFNTGFAFFPYDRWTGGLKPTYLDGGLTRLNLNLEVNSLTVVYSNLNAQNTKINRNALVNAIVAKDANGSPVGYVGLLQQGNDSVGSTDLHLVKLDLSGAVVNTLLIGKKANTTPKANIDLGVKVVQCLKTSGKPEEDQFIVLGASNMRQSGGTTPPMDLFITKVDFGVSAPLPVEWHRWIGLSIAGGDGEFLGYDIIPIQNLQGDWDGYAILGSLHDNSWNCGGGMHKPFICRVNFDGKNYYDKNEPLQAQVFPDNRMYENLTGLNQGSLSLFYRAFFEDERNYTTKHGFCRTNDGGYAFVSSGAGKFYKQYCLTKTDTGLFQECSNGLYFVDSADEQTNGKYTYSQSIYDSSEEQSHLTHQHSLSKEISLIHWDHCCRDYGDTYSQCVNQEYVRHEHVGLVRIGHEDEPEGRLGWNAEGKPEQKNFASIVPNPSGESPARLQLQEKCTGSVSIYNQWGVLVAAPIELNYQNSVTLPNNMVSGLYFVRVYLQVQLDSQTQTLKWVITKP